MAYSSLDGVLGPDAVLAALAQYAAREGWTVLENCVPDLDIEHKATYDGKKLSLRSPDGSVFAVFRSANGTKIFQSQKNTGNAYGIGCISSTGHTQNPPSGYWYDMPEAPKLNGNGEVIGVGIPVPPASSGIPCTVVMNIVKSPAPLIVLSVGFGNPIVCQHIAVGGLQKVGNWDGGNVLTASRNSYSMFASGFNTTTVESESYPIFSMNSRANTFVRIDADNAPLRTNNVLWASAGERSADPDHAYTGKQLALSMMTPGISEADKAHVPHYDNLVSKSSTDTGKNVNTLNCITVNMNLVAYVLRDPDELRNFSPIGYIPGVYFISMRNVATGGVYEINYPTSGQLHQCFPYTRRYGKYGMDGFSVAQDN